MAVYDVVDLTKIYPRQTTPANDRLTLSVAEGEIFGLLGDNGAGKTTLIRQMANLLAPTSGAIRLFGEPLGSAPLYVPGHIGYMPQDGLALNNLTVGETLYFTAHLRGLDRRDLRLKGFFIPPIQLPELHLPELDRLHEHHRLKTPVEHRRQHDQQRSTQKNHGQHGKPRESLVPQTPQAQSQTHRTPPPRTRDRKCSLTRFNTKVTSNNNSPRANRE